jgi:hypothetical protein
MDLITEKQLKRQWSPAWLSVLADVRKLLARLDANAQQAEQTHPQEADTTKGLTNA